MALDEAAHSLIACFECDLLMQKAIVPVGSRARCPRCGHILHQPVHDSIEKSLALALTGLLLFFPANCLPILTLSLLGKSEQETMLSGVQALYTGGYIWVATVVLLCSVIIPLFKLLLIMWISGCLLSGRRCAGLARGFRLYHWLNTWGMLEVFMLGVLVSMVKLMDIADVVPGIGLYCFAGLLLVTVILSALLDETTVWEQIEQHG